jgi:hypothetical protein
MMLQLIDLETVGTLAHWKGCLWWGIDIMDVLSNCSMDGPIKSPEVPAYCIVGWKKTSSTSQVLLQMCSQTWLKGENTTPSSQDTCITWINPVTVGVESKSWASGWWVEDIPHVSTCWISVGSYMWYIFNSRWPERPSLSRTKSNNANIILGEWIQTGMVLRPIQPGPMVHGLASSP